MSGVSAGSPVPAVAHLISWAAMSVDSHSGQVSVSASTVVPQRRHSQTTACSCREKARLTWWITIDMRGRVIRGGRHHGTRDIQQTSVASRPGCRSGSVAWLQGSRSCRTDSARASPVSCSCVENRWGLGRVYLRVERVTSLRGPVSVALHAVIRRNRTYRYAKHGGTETARRKADIAP